MGAISQAGYRVLLQKIGAPVNGSTMRACHIWQRAEGGSARFNPFNTTLHEPGATAYNTFGDHGQYHVWNYPNEMTGINATAATLKQSNFEHILQEFRNGTSGLAICEAVDHSAWGTHGAAKLYQEVYPSETHDLSTHTTDTNTHTVSPQADVATVVTPAETANPTPTEAPTTEVQPL
jgi:hypothetical protein